MKVYYENDIDPNWIKGKKVAVIGYGSQGFAHSNNLRDSGIDVVVGLRKDSVSASKVRETGIRVMETAVAALWADAVMVLVPDHLQAEIYERDLKPGLSKGNSLMFAHGFNIHFKQIQADPEIDVTMVAPKGPGHTVRRQYELGYGVPCLVAVENEASGNGKNIALAYAAAIGGARSGVIETNFKEETETDLFGEQAVLCGGLTHLMQAGFETLVDAGYAPEMAYFETIHEVKLIVDLIYEGGMIGMRYSVSDTAEYGDYVSGKRLINNDCKEKMKEILSEIQDGSFAKNWLEENKKGRTNFIKMRESYAGHQLEKTGSKLRSLMPWIAKDKLVDKTKN